jgi:hypothetical protein
MNRKLISDPMLGLAFLLGGTFVCVELKPDGLAANDGISYYGTLPETVAPYAVAILGSARTCTAGSSRSHAGCPGAYTAPSSAKPSRP